jgi:hypothetical protein
MLSRSGGGRRADPASGQGQVADTAAMALDQVSSSGGTGDRASLQQERRLAYCWLEGALDDALSAIGVAAGYNLHWLMRAIALLRACIQGIPLPSRGNKASNPCSPRLFMKILLMATKYCGGYGVFARE